MKLHILSDLHTEFDRPGTGFVPPETDADVVILAGDIGLHTHGLEWVVSQSSFDGKTILYVLGNHEFYGAEYFGIRQQCRLKVKEYQALGVPIYLLDDDVLVINGERFLGCQLWTDYRLFGEVNMPFCMSEAKRGMNDHKVIRYSDRGIPLDQHALKDSFFLPQHAERLHRKSKAFLSAELAKPFDGKTVVITHHLPSRLSVATRYDTDLLSAAFASNLDNLVENADLWIHGHTHDPFDYELGKCRVICNPRGYPSENFRNGFQPGLVVEV